LLASSITLLLGRWPRARTVAGVVTAFILAGWIGTLTLDNGVSGAGSLFAGDTWLVIGRPLTLTGPLQDLLVFLLIGLGILFLFAFFFPQDSAFVPAALAAFSPLAAALLVELFSFGAVFLVIGVALFVMTYKPQKMEKTDGALRYLLIFALALPLLLFVGWLFESRQATFFSPLVIRVLALALAMILAGFPFYIWVYPLVAEAPYLVPALIFGLGQTAVITFIYSLLQANPWLPQDPQFQLWLRWSGVGTILVAALLILTAAQWRFLLGHLLLFNMGMAILALTLPQPGGWEVSILAHVTRFGSLLIAGGALSLLQRYHLDPAIAGSRGLGRQSPLAVALLAYAFFSLLGTPFTPGFFSQWAVIAGIGHEANIWLSVLLVSALAASVYAVLRVLIVLFEVREGEEESPETKDPQWLNGFIAVLLLLAIILALFPQPILALVSRLTATPTG
jgi:multicomponent Na+:H+ antiporter subunit D